MRSESGFELKDRFIVRCIFLVGMPAALLCLASLVACDVELRKSDAELGLNAEQAAGRKICDAEGGCSQEPYSARGKKGPSLKGIFQHKYLSLSGLPANNERGTDIARL